MRVLQAMCGRPLQRVRELRRHGSAQAPRPQLPGCLRRLRPRRASSRSGGFPTSCRFAEGAMLDPASIALHTANRGEIRPGDNAAVLGPGPIGLLAADAAYSQGAGRVIVVGRGNRLAKAAEMGFEIGRLLDDRPRRGRARNDRWARGRGESSIVPGCPTPSAGGSPCCDGVAVVPPWVSRSMTCRSRSRTSCSTRRNSSAPGRRRVRCTM